MKNSIPPISYADYLNVGTLLSLQKRRSVEFGKPAHDETLFIIVHQVYELWFKQILTELNASLAIFAQPEINEQDMGHLLSCLTRIVSIQKILIDQVTVLETMTPLDFLEFRDLLYPASGFQSVQFREIENKLGLKREDRLTYNDKPYTSYLASEESSQLQKIEAQPSLFELLDQWLARTPFLAKAHFSFWESYQKAVYDLFARDKSVVESNSILDATQKTKNIQEIEESERSFQALFDAAQFQKAREQGIWRLSHPSIQACLLIQLHRDQPILHLPHLILTALQDIDENFTQWRYRHSLMAHRMLGRKIGTGGSSGAAYLKASTDKHRIFADLFNLSTFLIPRSALPELSEAAKKDLGFYYRVKA